METGSARHNSVSSREREPRELSIGDLRQQHANILTHAIFSCSSTPTARLTYAQIIDGAPLNHVVKDVATSFSWVYPLEHPVRTHVELCPGVLDRAKDFCSTFDLKVLKFDSQVLRAYCAAVPGSREFETRLMEMVAVAIHQIAVYLYKLDLDLGNHKDIATWVSPKDNRVLYKYYPDGKLPTLFVHRQYRDFSQYPEGISDMVGYWAEAQIFGGVVLFDHREPSELDPLADSGAIFFHPNHKNVTYRIWKLLDTQREKLVRFLLSDPDQTDTVSSPFPIHADSTNVTRIEPEEPIHRTGVYRDLWERKPLGDDDGDRRAGCTAYNSLDYISHDDFMRSKERCSARRLEIELRFEAQLEAEIEAEELERAFEHQESAK